jgi:membrane-associated phospholipid phosphatase
MKKLLLPTLLLMSFGSLEAQDTLYVKDSAIYASNGTTVFSSYAEGTDVKRPSPYTVKYKRDIPINLGLIGLNVLGVYLVNAKEDLTMAELATKTRDKVPFFDRGNVGYFDEDIDKASYTPFYASFAWPVVMMLADGDQTRHIGQVLTMYIQTMAVTGAMFSITAGLVERSRPLVYGENTPIGRRLSNNSQRSFYAGHTAATAASTFFTAKVFSDMNPDSKLKPVVWVIAAGLPALVGYQRYKSGQHFLSDNLLGYGLGAAAGILIPKWHKTSKKSKDMGIFPAIGPDYRGLVMVYKFK